MGNVNHAALSHHETHKTHRSNSKQSVVQHEYPSAVSHFDWIRHQVRISDPEKRDEETDKYRCDKKPGSMVHKEVRYSQCHGCPLQLHDTRGHEIQSLYVVGRNCPLPVIISENAGNDQSGNPNAGAYNNRKTVSFLILSHLDLHA